MGTWPPYLERVLAMIGATLIFWAKVAEHQVRMMWADRTLFSPREWIDLLGFLFVRPGGLRQLVPLYFAYYRPGFHPWDFDHQELLEAWKRELESSPVYKRAAEA